MTSLFIGLCVGVFVFGVYKIYKHLKRKYNNNDKEV